MAASSKRASGPLTLQAPAKVNLYLHVTGRRDDGLHLLESLVVFTGVGDTLTVSADEKLRLSVDGPHAAAIGGATEDNLVLRAAKALAAEGGPGTAHLHLTKNLPVASGIGGGSADAAAALKGLNALWGLNVPGERLAEISLALGADLPVCLAGRPALMRGIGDVLKPARIPEGLALVLANPGAPVSTPAIFKAFREGGQFREEDTAQPDNFFERIAAAENSLQPFAMMLLPVIGDVLQALTDLKGCRLARMSGSGATCFGLFDDLDAAEAAADELRARQPGWWIAAGPILS